MKLVVFSAFATNESSDGSLSFISSMMSESKFPFSSYLLRRCFTSNIDWSRNSYFSFKIRISMSSEKILSKVTIWAWLALKLKLLSVKIASLCSTMLAYVVSSSTKSSLITSRAILFYRNVLKSMPKLLMTRRAACLIFVASLTFSPSFSTSSLIVLLAMISYSQTLS